MTSAVRVRRHRRGRRAIGTLVANASKKKGDRFEREAAAYLIDQAPDLVLPDCQRYLGAGRKDDIGDLRAFHDTTVQVKAYNDPLAAIRLGVAGARAQSTRADTALHLGMVPVPRASKTDPNVVRWLACTYEWPTPVETESWGLAGRAVNWVRTADQPIDSRVTSISTRGLEPFYLGSMQAWLAAYRTRRNDPAPAVTS